jgi:hypothetical protein
MAVREFDGTDDRIVCDPGDVAITNFAQGNYTIIALVKPTTNTGTEIVCGVGDVQAGPTNVWLCSLAQEASNVGLADQANVYMAAVTRGTVWEVCGITKASGTTGVNAHRKALGSGSWSRSTSGATTAGVAGTPDRVEFSGLFSGSFTSYKDMRLAVVAIFDRVLSNAEIDGIETAATTQAIFDLGPIGLWEFNQASVGTAVTDLTGGGADQNAINGTTVVTGDDPAWTFGVASNQVGYPSADSVDGSWLNSSDNNTDMYASINDPGSGDAAYIKSPLNPSNSGVRFKLGTLANPEAGTRTLSWRIGKDATGGGTIDMKMQLRQGGGNSLGGGTLVQEFTRNNVDAATTYDESVTGTITDYADLYVEFYATQV